MITEAELIEIERNARKIREFFDDHRGLLYSTSTLAVDRAAWDKGSGLAERIWEDTQRLIQEIRKHSTARPFTYPYD